VARGIGRFRPTLKSAFSADPAGAVYFPRSAAAIGSRTARGTVGSNHTRNGAGVGVGGMGVGVTVGRGVAVGAGVGTGSGGAQDANSRTKSNRNVVVFFIAVFPLSSNGVLLHELDHVREIDSKVPDSLQRGDAVGRPTTALVDRIHKHLVTLLAVVA
jgi:hypothetical protein